jgi:molybdate transport system substrate-binding protein
MHSQLFRFLVGGLRSALVSVSLLSAALTVSPARGAEVTVFAAASLIDSLKEAATRFEKQTGDKVYFNFAASSVLEKQIEEGAPADIFFSADEAKMDALEKKGLVVKETRKDRLSNSLVIVTAADRKVDIHSAADLAGDKVKRLALADPKAVPAGIYARAFLEKEKLWPAVEPKVIPTDNVRAALAAVESGNVEAGIVFKTDAAISKKVKIAYAVAPEDGPVIRYPLALIKGSKQVEAARKFLQYLDSDDAAKVFKKYGFIVLPGSEK